MKEIQAGATETIPFFSGDREILIVGSGEVVLMRSLQGHLYPMTDGSGEPIVYSGMEDYGVLLNASISNDSQKVTFALQCTAGSIKYLVSE